MKKILLVLIMCMMFLCLVGCQRKNDTVTMYGKSQTVFDNISIDAKEGYFYESHEKFTVDENTIGITIYFSKDADNSWESEVAGSGKANQI